MLFRSKQLDKEQIELEIVAVDAALEDDPERLRDALGDLGFLHKPKRVDAERLMAHVKAVGGWYLADREVSVDPMWVMNVMTAVTDPRSEFYSLMRRENLPANELMGRRMEFGVLAVLEKERPAQQVAEIGYVIGDVRGKVAVIVDDMIDTGGTLGVAAQTVLDAGAKKVYAVATHGVFSGNAFETLGSSPLSGIVVTDTIPLRDGAPSLIQQLTCADILADTVRRIFTDDSVSEVFGGENQLF